MQCAGRARGSRSTRHKQLLRTIGRRHSTCWASSEGTIPMMTRAFWLAALERLLKTVAQVLLGLLASGSVGLLNLDWRAGAAATAAARAGAARTSACAGG